MADELYVTRTGVTVDPRRFKSKGDALLFEPFPVERTQSLADAIDSGDIDADDDLLLVAHDEQTVIALSREQMAFHHVASGVAGDQPWVVFF